MKKQFQLKLVKEGGRFAFDPETMVMLRLAKSGEWVDASDTDRRLLKEQLEEGKEL